MALIKKQVFLRSRDENVQQFLAKKEKKPLPKIYRDDDIVADEDGASYPNDHPLAPYGRRKNEAKSEPKSPWDDESDALDPRTKVSKGRSHEKGTRSDRRLDAEKNRPDLEGTTDDLLDQGSDNSNTADDRTQKEFIIEGVQDAWFEKADGGDNKPPKKALDRLDFSGATVRIDPKTGEKQYMGVKPKNEPGGWEGGQATGKAQTATFEGGRWNTDLARFYGAKPENKTSTLRSGVKKAVEDAWFEKRGPLDLLTGGRAKIKRSDSSDAIKGRVLELNLPDKLRDKALASGARDPNKKDSYYDQPGAEAATKAAGLHYASKSDDYTSNFWFGKATRNQAKLNRRAGLRATREKIDTDAMSSSEKAAFNKKADANMREANERDPGLMYSAPQNVTSQDNRRYRSEIAAANTKKAIQGELIDMNSIQQGVYDAWLEKRGPIDKLTGGRVKFETDRTKQAVDRGPKFLGVPGVEMQTELKRGGLGAKLHGAIGGKETTPSQKRRMAEGKVKAAGLDYAAKGWFSEAIMEALLEKAEEDFKPDFPGDSPDQQIRRRLSRERVDQGKADRKATQVRPSKVQGRKADREIARTTERSRRDIANG